VLSFGVLEWSDCQAIAKMAVRVARTWASRIRRLFPTRRSLRCRLSKAQWRRWNMSWPLCAPPDSIIRIAPVYLLILRTDGGGHVFSVWAEREIGSGR
jgi:hypothetical protein